MEGEAATVDERIIAHLPFARAIAARSLDPRCRGADREDLIAWGVVGLVQAAARYRETAGASFRGYAAQRVRGQVLDALRAKDPLTRSARRAYKIARDQGDAAIPPVAEVSLDRWIAAGREPQTPPQPRKTRDPRWERVRRELATLPDVERRVLVLSYGRGLTLKEIGRRVGLSESGTCRLRVRALRALRMRCAA